MLYPKYLSIQGYSKELLKEYYQQYGNFLSENEIKKTIEYIVDVIITIIEKNKGDLLIVAIEWLSKIEKWSKEECIDFSKKIGLVDSMSILFGSVQIPP